MGNLIIILILLVIVALAVYSTIRRIRYGSSCCGERDAAPKKVKVTDRNKAHYLHEYVLKVDGMHCSNCARRVENALNSGEGRWATANIEKKEVILLSKSEENENEIGKIVASAGYTMLSFRRNALLGGHDEKTIGT